MTGHLQVIEASYQTVRTYLHCDCDVVPCFDEDPRMVEASISVSGTWHAMSWSIIRMRIVRTVWLGICAVSESSQSPR